MGGGVGGGRLRESVKLGKFVSKIFFPDVVWSSKNEWKMISADIKFNIKQREIKDVVTASHKLL